MKYKSLFYLTIACCACTCILAFPYASTRGISKGIELCLSVIIPSLYPFTVCSMVIFEYIVHINVKHNSAIKFISGLDAELFIIYFLSCVGGYPIGAMLIENEFKENRISKKDCETLLYFCVNSAPSFTITIIGSILYKSTLLGMIIYFSGISASLIISRIVSNKIRYTRKPKPQNFTSRNFSEILISKTYDSVRSMVCICSLIVLFSSIIELIKSFAPNNKVTEILLSLLEITSGIYNSDKNIYCIAFLSGFAGFCVHFQILSICNELKPNYAKLFASRLIHGSLTASITFIAVKLFKISIPTLSHKIDFTIKVSEYSSFFALLLLITSVLFIVSVNFSLKRE